MTFFNIFSKEPLSKESKKKIEIIIDHREKNSLVASFLSSHGFKITFKQLPVADYLVREIAIERKSLSDFKASIINKRIISQLIELKQYPKSLLILEGITEKDLYEGIIHENAFRGFLLSVALDYQMPIIFTKNEEDTAKYISVLAKKEKKSHPSIRPSKIILSKEERMQFILEGFPNIGPKKAKALLEKFRSLKNIFDASEEDLQPILGIRSKEFLEIITAEAKFRKQNTHQ